MLGITVRNLSSRDAATVCTLRAVDRVFDTLSNGFKATLDEVMALHPGAEALILLTLFLTEPLNLHEVGGELFRQSGCKDYYRG